MSDRQKIETILKLVNDLPPEDRRELSSLLASRASDAESDRVARNTFDRALGIARGSSPPPTDEEVKQIIDEHRMNKYER